MYHCLAWFIKREFCIQATQLFPCSIHNVKIAHHEAVVDFVSEKKKKRALAFTSKKNFEDEWRWLRKSLWRVHASQEQIISSVYLIRCQDKCLVFFQELFPGLEVFL